MAHMTLCASRESRHAARSSATRRKLIGAARELFTARGYADVGTTEIARAAGVTRGALYHQFADKAELMAAVVDEIDAEMTQELATGAMAAGDGDPVAILTAGATAFLEAVTRQDVHRVLLVDALPVLGWERWREIDAQHFGGKLPRAIAAAMEAGLIARQPVEPLARLLLGAVTEAAVACAGRADIARAGAEYARAFKSLVEALRLKA